MIDRLKLFFECTDNLLENCHPSFRVSKGHCPLLLVKNIIALSLNTHNEQKVVSVCEQEVICFPTVYLSIGRARKRGRHMVPSTSDALICNPIMYCQNNIQQSLNILILSLILTHRLSMVASYFLARSQ